MAKELDIRSNGFELKSPNRRLRVIERTVDEDGIDKGVRGFIIEIKRYIPNSEDRRPAATYTEERGICTTSIALSEEALHDLYLCLREYKRSKLGYVMKREYTYGWDFTEFDEDEKPIVYSTREEADKQLAEFIENVNDAFERGDLDEAYQDDCRIFKLREGEL